MTDSKQLVDTLRQIANLEAQTIPLRVEVGRTLAKRKAKHTTEDGKVKRDWYKGLDLDINTANEYLDCFSRSLHYFTVIKED